MLACYQLAPFAPRLGALDPPTTSTNPASSGNSSNCFQMQPSCRPTAWLIKGFNHLHFVCKSGSKRDGDTKSYHDHSSYLSINTMEWRKINPLSKKIRKIVIDQLPSIKSSDQCLLLIGSIFLIISNGCWLNQYPDSNNLLSALSNFYSSGGSSKISLIDLYYLPTQCPGIL